jgi:hypothetical protein
MAEKRTINSALLFDVWNLGFVPKVRIYTRSQVTGPAGIAWSMLARDVECDGDV